MPRSHRPIARLFIAAYPPRHAAEAMLASLHSRHDASSADNDPRWRLTPVDMVHLTILFLGPVPSDEIDAVSESVERATSGLPAICLTPQRLITLPPGRPPRVMAVETDNPAPLPELRDRLVRRLAKQPRRRPSDRFLPHFTLARFTRGADIESMGIPIELPPFRIDHIQLVRSVLRPDGPVHTPIETYTLKPKT